MNINTIRANLQSQINSVYATGIGVSDTSAIIRSELTLLLTDLQLLEKTLPSVNDAVYTETARHEYEAMVKHWIQNVDNIYIIVETIKACRFSELTTPIQLWSRLMELAVEVDKDTKLNWKGKFLKSCGVKNQYWVKRVQTMHPSKLEEFRKRNKELQQGSENSLPKGLEATR